MPTTSPELLMPHAELELNPSKVPSGRKLPEVSVKNAWLRPPRLKVPAIASELLMDDAVAPAGPSVFNDPFAQRKGYPVVTKWQGGYGEA